ncbi:unnamed protein product [Caenorhabditis auriculariae]|uniref:Methyltransferase-like protein 9 n=1 Tax=Caenorhabditis auriculariae TaxID=2777116 RepID=A0A8S1GVS3_9PELO|nr:unnamed protein product [Caenorhabditis auriculariae]
MGADLRSAKLRDMPRWWYSIEKGECQFMHRLFKPSRRNYATLDFIEESSSRACDSGIQLTRNFCGYILSFFLPETCVDGLLGRSRAFLLSSSQFSDFLALEADHTREGKSVLDLGAGDGSITKKMEPFFENVYATETSQKLLEDIRKVALQFLCPVVISIAFPDPERESRSTRPPDSNNSSLKIFGETFEEKVEWLTTKELAPAGFEVTSWTKVPYLKEGDSDDYFYDTESAVLLLRALQENEIDACNDRYFAIGTGDSSDENSEDEEKNFE